MGKTAAEYKQQYKALLPPGRLWDSLRREGSVADDFWAAQAEEFARVDQRAEDLLAEANPYTAFEMLPDWEEWAGLPDVCAGSLASPRARLSDRIASSLRPSECNVMPRLTCAWTNDHARALLHCRRPCYMVQLNHG